ncbi:unnamed protein product [Brachionus calyciflorus]|uniref:Peptidase metallopeptidase domain-containing protein n=1 Tax=Brachionus calyciflorus TaxID=104777 RepID=A0A813MJG5_9BILA|nr:unnamed protein product [Brachionus calyciflorus]
MSKILYTSNISIIFLAITLVKCTYAVLQQSETNNTVLNGTAELDPLWYLNRFGYLDGYLKNSKKSANLMMIPSGVNSTNPFLELAIKRFQKFAGLNQTGILDEETLKMMKTPRCGHPDKLADDNENKSRKKRYALQGSKWPKSNIRYKISKYPKYGIMNKDEIDEELKEALELWSENSDLEFQHIKDKSERTLINSLIPNTNKKDDVDIEIRFESGYHGDSEPFDGSGLILGHAYFPEFGGATHFDSDEFWTRKSPNGVNLYQVAVHEFGHALGLEHSDNFDAIMAPFFRGYTPDFKLHSDDLTGIEMLYGKTKRSKNQKSKIIPNFRNNMPNVYKNDLNFDILKLFSSTPNTRTTKLKPERKRIHSTKTKSTISSKTLPPNRFNRPEYYDPAPTISLCLDGKFDAISVLSDGYTYIFKDSLVYKIDSNFRMDKTYPKLVNSVFKGKNGLTYMNLPSNLDSVLYVPENGLTYFFKNNLYWRSSRLYELDPGYPRLISDNFRGLNSKNGFNGKIDASFVWSGNRRVYFIEDNKYWRFDFDSGAIEPGYPKSLSVWRGLPLKITDAFLWINGITYFFANDKYYRFNDLAFKVEEDSFPPYPRLNKDYWFGCNNINKFGKLVMNSTNYDGFNLNETDVNEFIQNGEPRSISKIENRQAQEPESEEKAVENSLKNDIEIKLNHSSCISYNFLLVLSKK